MWITERPDSWEATGTVRIPQVVWIIQNWIWYDTYLDAIVAFFSFDSHCINSNAA
jgi:hypothetical protein